MPAQATSYFYGYSRLQALRAETELMLSDRDRFDRKAFNDFLLAQGMLPPSLLDKAVHEEFIPSSGGAWSR